MGVDAEVWVRLPALTSEQVRALHEHDLPVSGYVKDGYIVLSACRWARYYHGGSRYREYWPTLADAIRSMQEVFGFVYYTNDHMEFDYGEYDRPWTEEDSARLWVEYNKGGEE